MGANASSFPYEEGEEMHQCKNGWKIKEGISKQSKEKVTVLTYTSRGDDSYIEKCIQTWKTLKHPSIRPILHYCMIEKTHYVIIPYSLPLCKQITQTPPSYRLIGLYDVTVGLSFLHDRGYSFTLLTEDNILVSKGGHMYLSFFLLLSNSVSSATSSLQQYPHYIDKSLLPIEVQRLAWNDLSNAPIHSIDSYLYYHFVEQYFSSSTFQSFLRRIGRCKDFQPSNRYSLAHILKDRIFEQEPCKLYQQLVKYAVLDEAEQMQCLESLQQYKIENEMDSYFLLPILTPISLLTIHKAVVVAVLTCAKFVDAATFRVDILPLLLKWYELPNRAVRVLLLESISLYVDQLDAHTVSNDLYPKMNNGFHDQSDRIRELSIQAIVALAPKLHERVINVDLMRTFSKLQLPSNEKVPIIRTNTTLAIGMMAKYLKPSSRNQIMMSAFTRALKDPYPLARLAGIKALAATIGYYPSSLIATKILPLLMPLLVDGDKQVAELSRQTARDMIQKIEVYVQNDNQDIVDQDGDIQTTPNRSYWNWASNLATKIYKNSSEREESRVEEVRVEEAKVEVVEAIGLDTWGDDEWGEIDEILDVDF